MSDEIEALYDVVKLLTSQPECETCRLCEENVGLVYLLGNEVEKANVRSTISETSAGVKYFRRTKDGWCPQYDKETNRCRIYSHRPLCCRLYPMDLMKLDGDVWWVAHMECPIFKRFLRDGQMEILQSVTEKLERTLTPRLLEEWLREDNTSQIIEAFAREKYRIQKLRKLVTRENTDP